MVQRAAEQQDEPGELPPEESLPKQFGKYTLLRKLAAGGMAELFLALHRSVAGFEKLIVIKRILPSMNQDKGFIEMLLHEARIAATLSHPNIVQIFDVGQIDGKFFIAMEHIHGEDIRSIVRAMKKKNVAEFPLEHTISIVLGMCAGLAYAHEKRDLDGATLDIVHRDISPQNIVITFTGDVKVVDFGIAKSGAQVEDTKDGQLKGKVPYMSPEQAAGDPIDWRSDIFAAGVMLFELTTGKRLFKGASEYETLKLIIDRDYPLPTQVRPGYPAALERIVMKALAKRREDRYQSAREMQSDLESFVREERIPVSPVGLTRWMQSLFEEKLAQQKEALQDIKQLADIIAVQQASIPPAGSSLSMYDGTLTTGTGTGMMSAPGASSSIPAPPRRSPIGLVIAGIAVVGLFVGGFFYMRKVAADAAAAKLVETTATTTTVTAPPDQPRGWLEIKSSHDGCAIWLNGDLRMETTPAKIEKLPLGKEIQVKLTKEGLEAYRETVTLSEDSPGKTINAAMKGGSVVVLLKIEPPAMIWLDGKPWRGDQKKIEGLSADEEHTLVLSASGFTPKTVTFTPKRGETKTIQERLVKADPNAKQPPSGGEKDPPTPPAGGSSKVRVGAKGGFCNVTINGSSYGATPVEAVVPAGNVRVSCKPANGPSMSQSVKVAAGETARVGFKIDP
jgi:eukaryotic-like serine/threonine-protein kinase